MALARAGKENGFRRPLEKLLDGLSIETLSATERHHTTLTQLACKTLGDIRRLPRGGVSRRFDKELLTALDQAYGLRPEVHTWVQIPEGFKARLELMSRVDMAPALLFGARQLIVQMCGWLAARHAGITAFVLRWAHDSMRSKNVGEGGELVIRTAAPMREIEHSPAEESPLEVVPAQIFAAVLCLDARSRRLGCFKDGLLLFGECVHSGF